MVEIYLLVTIVSLIILTFLLSRLWIQRETTGATELFLCGLACGLWSLGYLLEILIPGISNKLLFAKFQYLGIGTVSAWVLLFILRYTGRISKLNIRLIGVLLIIPTITILFAATNENYHLLWTSVSDQSGWLIAPLTLGHGPWFWVIIAYSYILLLSGTTILALHVSRIQKHYRSQPYIMLVSTIVPWVGNAFYIFGLRPGPNLDLTPIAFSITFIGLVLASTRFKLLEVLPIAYSSIFEHMSDGVIVLDVRNRVIDINPAGVKIFYRPNLSPPTRPILAKNKETSPIIGHHITEFLPDWQNFSTDSTRSTEEIEIRIRQFTSKSERVFSLRTTPIRNPRKQLTGHVLIFTDITNLKQAEAQLLAAHHEALESGRMKTQLLANVSHDMRTPLGAIIGFAEILSNGSFGDLNERQSSAVSDILDSAQQLKLFVNNMIGQAQFETGRILLKPRQFTVQELFDECQGFVHIAASKKNLQLVCEVDPNLPNPLFGDLYWLRQIVLNLVNNALKFTDQGRITLRVYLSDPEHWAIEVSDTGPGISKDDQALIFEPFRQADGTLTRERSGSGLGLAIVKELTNLMSGKVNLVSYVGVGSVFTVCIPLDKPENFA